MILLAFFMTLCSIYTPVSVLAASILVYCVCPILLRFKGDKNMKRFELPLCMQRAIY